MKLLPFKLTIILIIFTLLTLLTSIFSLLGPKNRYAFNHNPQTVIKQVQSLSRLETSSFTIEKIIDAGTTGNKLQQFFLGDRLLLVAHGTVIAGFDMAKMKEKDIEVKGDTLKLTLPAPEILVTTLNNEQTRVYDRQRGVLTRGDNNLESEARKEAESLIREAACTGGILNEATKNARNQLTAMFKSMGFVTVIIEAPQGEC